MRAIVCVIEQDVVGKNVISLLSSGWELMETPETGESLHIDAEATAEKKGGDTQYIVLQG